MLTIRKEADRVYSLAFDNRKDLCLCFLRYQEYYESDNPRFQYQAFTWADYVTWYSKTRGSFSYSEDWMGFNFPADVIGKVKELGIPDPNHYDDLMSGVLGLITNDAEHKDVYLIGYQKGSAPTLDHEMAHAAFYLDGSYRDEVNDLLLQLPDSVRDRISSAIQELGYASSSVVDEIQAFALTGSRKRLWKGRAPKSLRTFYDDLERVYSKYRLKRA